MEEQKDEDITIDYVDPNDLINNNEDFEILPPENKAKQLNVGNILLILFVAIILIVGFIYTAKSFNFGQKKESEELEKAGIKYIPDIELNENNLFNKNEQDENAKSQKNIDEIIDNIPDIYKQNEPGVAPITTVNTSTSTTSTRPDTRNSISIRKISGLIGSERNIDNQNEKAITQAMKGNYNYNNVGTNNNQRMSKEEYISNLLSQSQFKNTSSNDLQSNKEKFYNNSENTVGQGEYLSAYSLWDGTVITGALETAINTDNPGQVIARVTENVYSSYDSSFLLIPSGTLLFADYNSSVSYGQNRVQIAWNLLIRPDGYRLQLGNMNGVDQYGQSGAKGSVNNHPFQTLKALGLVAMYSIIQTEVNKTINDQTNEYIQNSLTDVYTQGTQLANKVLDRALDIKPTIKLKQGEEIKIITNAPLELPPMKINQVNQKYIRLK